jgi:hypothetical protein
VLVQVFMQMLKLVQEPVKVFIQVLAVVQLLVVVNGAHVRWPDVVSIAHAVARIAGPEVELEETQPFFSATLCQITVVGRNCADVSEFGSGVAGPPCIPGGGGCSSKFADPA